jgi:hypothetical protein
LTDEYGGKFLYEQSAQQKLYEDRGILEVEFTNLKHQVDKDCDDEIDTMKLKYSQRLNLEEDTVVLFLQIINFSFSSDLTRRLSHRYCILCPNMPFSRRVYKLSEKISNGRRMTSRG